MPKKKTKTKKDKPTKSRLETQKEEIANSKDPDFLLGDRRKPRGWNKLTYEQKLDYIATRLIAEDRRGITSHKELKESGILSVSQYERRRKREVYSQLGDLDTVKVKEGQFSRVHVRDLRGLKESEGAEKKSGKVIKSTLKKVKKKVKKDGGKQRNRQKD